MRLQILQRNLIVPATAQAALVPAPALVGPRRATLTTGVPRSAS